VVPNDPLNTTLDIEGTIENKHPLYLIVGEKSVSPCDHATFTRFQRWVVETCTEGQVDTYVEGNVSIDHWQEQDGAGYPFLLNPCECGTYMPMEVDPNPMFSSAIGLLSDLKRLKDQSKDMPDAYRKLIDAMMEMAELSLDTNTTMEIR